MFRTLLSPGKFKQIGIKCEIFLASVRDLCETTPVMKNQVKRKEPEITFSVQIKAARERIGIRQDTMAGLLGISPRALWQWEAGKEPPLLTRLGVLRLLEDPKFRSLGWRASGLKP